ncbi:MAG: PQQ-dependent sugar dehydrogenase [Flavobacteriaceae bacterium]|nr:PQQ-dependent sugar dehydrogenase [Flavobacteriaceae bacterium]
MNIRIIILFVGLLMSCSDNTSVFEVPSTDPDNGGLILPQGFGALVVADSVGPARHLAVNTNGDIYIKLRIDTGDKGNMALRDVDGDGKADIFKRFGDYPNDGRFATEMKIHNDYLYYSSELVVYRQKLDPNNLIPKGKPEVIMVDEYPIRWHNAKSLAFDNKGGMYVTFSAPTNACEDLRLTAGDPNAVVKGEFPCSQLNILGGVWRFDENKHEQRQSDGVRFATGLRSIVGITWNKKQDNLYAVNHGRDYLHNHAPDYYSKWENSVLPSEEFMIIKKDDDFGWPYTYYDHFKSKRMLAPEYGGDGKQEAKGYAEPIMGLPAHWAPNDLLFYTGSQFPDRYKDGAFIAFHGSTNRGPYPQAGYIVAFIPFKNGKPAGNLEVFADGFTQTDLVKQMKDSKYRPMGLAQGPDGSLYISESKNGKIWRVIFNGDRLNFDNKALKQMESLKQKSYLRIPDKELDLLPIK